MVKKLTIGGLERPMCFNFNCLEEFQDMTGINALNGFGDLNPKQARALIFCGLKYGVDPEGAGQIDFTEKKVGSWLDAETIVDALKVFAGQTSKPEEKKSDAENLSQ